MAEPTTLTGDQILIQVEMVPESGTYTHPCLINTERGISWSSNVISELVPDCADPSAPAWNRTEIDGLSATISGSGMYDVTSAKDFFDWYKSGLSKNVKVKENVEGGSTYTGAFKLSEFGGPTGPRKTRATSSVTLISDGEVTRADNP